jgi:hypothetical protein
MRPVTYRENTACGRPPVGQDRLQLTPDGKAVLELRRRWTDGTTHLVFIWWSCWSAWPP